MKKLVIFGTGAIAELASFYFETDSDYEIIAFTVDDDFVKEDLFCSRPVVPASELNTRFPSSEYSLFIAISYSKLNKVRQNKYNCYSNMGYKLASYVSSKCNYLSNFMPGRNAFILEDNTIQPQVTIEDNVTIWSGNHVGHHSVIRSHNFISSHVVISGHCDIGSNCFIGVNATIGHKVTIGEECIIGAGAIIVKSTEPRSVYVAPRSIKIEKLSSEVDL